MDQPADRPQNPKTRSGRSGTETRQKQRRVTYRLSEAEYEEVETLASNAGLTLASYTRTRVLPEPTTQSRHRPSVEVMAILKLRGVLNKIGTNIYQLNRHVNYGRLIDPDGEIAAAFADYRETTAVIRAALGRHESPPPEASSLRASRGRRWHHDHRRREESFLAEIRAAPDEGRNGQQQVRLVEFRGLASDNVSPGRLPGARGAGPGHACEEFFIIM